MRFLAWVTSIAGFLSLILIGVVSLARQQTPRSQLIAFASDIGGNYDLYTMRRDGGHWVHLTHSRETEAAPAWSPDGGRLAFFSRTPQMAELYFVNADGSQRHSYRTGYEAYNPDWSPDGTWLVLCHWVGGSGSIYRIQPHDHVSTRLSNGDTPDYMPVLSPDGEWIAFVSQLKNGFDVFKMRTDGSERQNLTALRGSDSTPAWSPDGGWIVFSSSRGGKNLDLYLMRPDGSQLHQLTDAPQQEEYPDWSPDGAWIVFEAATTQQTDLYRIRPDGTERTQLTNTPDSSEITPAWSPIIDYPLRPVWLLAGSLGLFVIGARLVNLRSP